MGRGGVAGPPHFAEAHLESCLGALPRGFGAGEAAADDVDVEAHGLPLIRSSYCRHPGLEPGPACS